ncbi:hypothetical protein CF166_12805 [Amycolatopsis sp. KNN50.9b]|nr:hypothetical protein CF166_12805 [Amycolatopsis sp. KNN50.9b]
MAVDAGPDGTEAHRVRAEVFHALEKTATSTMAKGVYGWTVAESTAVLDGACRDEELRTRTSGRTQWAF